MFALRTLEFDRIVEALASLALTPLGAAELSRLVPATEAGEVTRALQATGETRTYLEQQASFGLRAGASLPDALSELEVVGRGLEPLALRTVADFLDSVELTAAAILRTSGPFGSLRAIASRAPAFRSEVAAVRHAIDPSGEVLDQASPELRSIRDRLRRERTRLRSTLDQVARGRDTAKYLQDQVVTERNGRYVLMVRAEHRGNVPGIVHGSSATGATLFLEPAATVEINNEIVEWEFREREEIARILLALSDAFRIRADDVEAAIDVAADLDVLQAKARFGALVHGTAPSLSIDGRLELLEARHPLLIEAVVRRLAGQETSRPPTPVPVDLQIEPPHRALLITGPNTGGKTVALKMVGLLAAMAQSGLHVPARRAVLPVFRSIFADIGDEQSIAASLSTFSSHIRTLVAMDRELLPPALILLDEVGTGTDPNEGGALATAIVSHFKSRGATLVATTHYDALKTWGAADGEVAMAAFAFDPASFAPTYRLVYGAPGRSLAIEMAQRLGLPLQVIAAARGFLSEDQKRLAAHLSRVDAQARALESERSKLQRQQRAQDEHERGLAERERTLEEREDRFNKRLNERLDERVRQARREIDGVIDQLKSRGDELVQQASAQAAARGISTGDAGAARASARASIEQIVSELKQPAVPAAAAPAASESLTVGARVRLTGLGMEGTVMAVQGHQVEIDVRGKRLKAPLGQLQVIAGAPAKASAATGAVRVNIDLQPRDGLLSELNVIGQTVDQAVDRVSRFLDDTLVTDLREVRIVHGHGTGQLRRGLQAYLKTHPLVAKYYPAPDTQGGGGATIVELKE